MKLIWLFKEYHTLREILDLHERNLERLTDKNLQLVKDNEALARSLELAQQHIRSNPDYLNSVMDLMQKYQEKVLEETPFGIDQHPEWLTPEYDDSSVKDGDA
jgi:uncharacterized membrane protein YheB (UPF0754 family)